MAEKKEQHVNDMKSEKHMIESGFGFFMHGIGCITILFRWRIPWQLLLNGTVHFSRSHQTAFSFFKITYCSNPVNEMTFNKANAAYIGWYVRPLASLVNFAFEKSIHVSKHTHTHTQQYENRLRINVNGSTLEFIRIRTTNDER